MKFKIFYLVLIAVVSFFIIDTIINYTMMKGINNYYGLNQDADILLIGHSHLMLATDKKRMEDELGMKVSKYTREGVNVAVKKKMVEHFLSNGNVDSLKYVLYGVDLATFTGEGLSKNSYKLFYPFMDNKYMDEFISEEADKSDYYLNKFFKSLRFNDDGIKNSAIRGLLNNWSNFKTNTIDIEWYKNWLSEGNERNIDMNDTLISQFKETISLLTDRNIKVILVNTPTLDLVNQYEPDKYQNIMNWYKSYANSNDLIEFWDFNPKYESDYSIFSDRIHVNNKGQQIITEEIIKKLKLEIENN